MFRLSIVTPEKTVYEDEINSLIAPGTVGYLGIMSNHAPLITSLQPGKFSFKDKDGKEIKMAISGGFLENSHNHCTILADSAEFASDIDLERASESLKRAERRLKASGGEIDLGRAREAYDRAKNRLKVAKDK